MFSARIGRLIVALRWINDKKKPTISSGFWTPMDIIGLCAGGDEGDRTPDLGIANAALSQLSYIPRKNPNHKLAPGKV